ncbi:hypothetical protein [Nocardiopsis sp. CNT-189]|uniref:hypothetical protein n=1 Tax=Nocardiopsis oceanisediminis TaxID=2816862 RepID=UPI003B3B2720
MALYVCSLINNDDQEIQPDAYTLLKFPYVGESYDPWGMHDAGQPDGACSTYPDDRSALIWPAVTGWGTLTAMIHWEGGDYTEVRDQYIRDPLNLAGGPDTTCTEHEAPNPGGQYRAKHHALFVHPDTPVAIRVRHNATSAKKVIHAQLKLAIEDGVATP